jgi:hypothetical protein
MNKRRLEYAGKSVTRSAAVKRYVEIILSN